MARRKKNKRRTQKRHVLPSLLLAMAAMLMLVSPLPSRQTAETPAPGGEEAPLESPAPAWTEPERDEDEAPSPAPVTYDEDAEKIRVSELMIKNRATLPDEDGDFSDWIELENISDSTVELTGWRLTDAERKPGTVLPATTLAPGERLLLFASGKDRAGHLNFALSGGESLYIYTDLGVLAQELTCPDGEADRAWVTDGAGGLTESFYPTPGLPNTPESYVTLMDAEGCDSPLVINEASPFNRSGRWKGTVGDSDWVELKNVSDAPLELSDYYLSDDPDQRLLFQLPEATLQPGALYLLRFNTEGSYVGSAALCTAFSLSSEADRLYLSRADGSLADYVSLRGIPYEGSFGRMPGQNGWFFFALATPGAENSGGERRISSMPVSLEPDGVFNGVESVTVRLSGSGEIHYTTDGSYPTLSSPVYTEPIRVERTGTVRAINLEEGALPSRALNLSYVMNENHSLPVACLVTDNDQFRGMYYGSRKDVEVPASLAFYTDEGSFTIPCGVKLNEESSLVLAKKNLSLRFRGAYGQAELHYDVFGDGGVCDFNNLLLRAGQDYFHAIIRNELCTELARAATDRVVVSRSRYCILYIDGKYFGIYAVEEKLNEAMYAHLAGVSRDSVTVETPPLDGKHSMYREVISYALTHDMANPEYYEELCKRLDVDSMIDWLILEGVFANDDLTYANVRYCRSLENDGKWRLMFYDLDSTFYHANTCFGNLLSPWARDSRQVAQLISALLRSPDFRDRLLTRAAELLEGPLSNERIIAEIDRLTEQIRPEVERDYGRFQLKVEDWEWNVQWMRDFILDNDWNQICVNNLCYYLNVGAEERARYFSK